MSPEDRQAQLLARWLEEPPGTEPPPELDPEVVEGVYGLRPDRAPAPRLDFDELFDSLTEGPLAGAPPASGGGASGAPTIEEAVDNVIPFPARRPWMIGGGAAVLFAAAAALVLAVRLQAPEPVPSAEVAAQTASVDVARAIDAVEGEQAAPVAGDFDEGQVVAAATAEVERRAREPNEAVAGVLRERQVRIAQCYDEATRRLGGLGGSLVLEWTVRGGMVRGMRVERDTIGDRPLADCIQDMLSTAVWPDDADGTWREEWSFTAVRPGTELPRSDAEASE